MENRAEKGARQLIAAAFAHFQARPPILPILK